MKTDQHLRRLLAVRSTAALVALRDYDLDAATLAQSTEKLPEQANAAAVTPDGGMIAVAVTFIVVAMAILRIPARWRLLASATVVLALGAALDAVVWVAATGSV